MTHDLKIWPEYYREKIKGIKPWEHRKNDRFFKVGDFIILREWDSLTKDYTGRIMKTTITYIHKLDNDYVIISDTSYEWAL